MNNQDDKAKNPVNIKDKPGKKSISNRSEANKPAESAQKSTGKPTKETENIGVSVKPKDSGRGSQGIKIIALVLLSCGFMLLFYLWGRQSVVQVAPEQPKEEIDLSKRICEFENCHLVLKSFPYKVYQDVKAGYVYDQVNDYSYALPEGAQAKYFVKFNDINIGLELKKDDKLALYSLATKEIIIPYGHYIGFNIKEITGSFILFTSQDKAFLFNQESQEAIFLAGNIIELSLCWDKETLVGVFLGTNENKKSFYSLADKALVFPFGTYYYLAYAGGNYLEFGYEIAEEDYLFDRYGIYDIVKKKEIVKNIDSIECSKQTCTLYDYSNNNIIDVFDFRKGEMLLKNRKYRNDAEVKKMLAILQIFSVDYFGDKKITDFNTLDNQAKLQMIYHYLLPEDCDFEKGVKSNVFRNNFQKIFGKDVDYQDGDVLCGACGGILLSYNKKNEKYYYVDHYEENDCDEGKSYDLCFYKEIAAVKQQDDLYELEIYMLFNDDGWDEKDGSRGVVWGDLDYKNVLFRTYYDLGFEGDAIVHYLANFNEYKKKSSQFKYTFRKEGKDFILVAYEYVAAK